MLHVRLLEIFYIKLQKRWTMWFPLILPLIDVITDHLFAINNTTKADSQAVNAIGVAALFNLALGPMIYGKKFQMNNQSGHGEGGRTSPRFQNSSQKLFYNDSE